LGEAEEDLVDGAELPARHLIFLEVEVEEVY
jgi:hypothetical protein